MHYPANIIIPTAAILLAVLGSVEAFREHHVDHYLHDDDEDEDAKIHLPVYRISTTGKTHPSFKCFFRSIFPLQSLKVQGEFRLESFFSLRLQGVQRCDCSITKITVCPEGYVYRTQ